MTVHGDDAAWSAPADGPDASDVDGPGCNEQDGDIDGSRPCSECGNAIPDGKTFSLCAETDTYQCADCVETVDAPRDTIEAPPPVIAPPMVDSRGGFPIERTPAACPAGRCDGSGLLRADVGSLYSAAGIDDRCPCGVAP